MLMCEKGKRLKRNYERAVKMASVNALYNRFLEQCHAEYLGHLRGCQYCKSLNKVWYERNKG
jgi:hypothetical protein